MKEFSRAVTLTDLYELTMAAGYFERGIFDDFTFELSVRRLPKHRSLLVACGIEEALEFLEPLRFTGAQIDYLRGLPVFGSIRSEFFDYLAGLRFEGRVRAVPEGTILFPEEPIMTVTASAPVAQIAETYLLNAVNFQTMIASKAVRVVDAAGRDGRRRPVVDFGSRRAHSPQAAVLAARASYIGGCAGTSNVFAARKFDLPVFGTMAHSWVMGFPSEREAFERYVEAFPANPTLLIDTYDTFRGAREAARFGDQLGGVRLDSGDLAVLSKGVRKILDGNGCPSAMIVASGDLDEYAVARLLKANAPVDAFGVGTKMVTSEDAPYLPTVYKLVERKDGRRKRPVLKTAGEKRSLPGVKQVWRAVDEQGYFAGDRIGLDGERVRGPKRLLRPVMRGGRRLRAPEPVSKARARCARQLKALDPKYRRLSRPARYPVRYSPELMKLYRALKGRVAV